jgi:hypothetical protein
MRRKRRRHIALIGALGAIAAAAGVGVATWTSEGNDPARTGRSAVTAAQEPAAAAGWPLLNAWVTGPAAIGSNNRIYVASSFGNTIRAYGPGGGEKWAFRVAPASQLRFFSPPTLGADGTIYSAGGVGAAPSAALFAILPNGTPKWQSAPVNDASFALRGAIVVTPTRVYVRSATRLNAYNTSDGVNVLSVAVPNAGTAAPTLAQAPDGSLYTASSVEPGPNAGELTALNVDGSVRWSRPVGRDPRIAIGDTGNIYVSQNVTQVPAQAARVTAFDSAGNTIWSVDIPGGASRVSAPAVTASGTVYVGTSDGLLRALIPGNPGWALNVGPAVADHRPAIGGDGTIYASAGTTLVAASTAGVLKWSAPTAGGPISIAPNGTVFTIQNSVYGFSGPTAAPLLSGLAAAPASFRVRGVSWEKAGTRLRFRLSRSADVRFVVRRGSAVVGTIAVDRTSSGDVPFSGTPGENIVSFKGRVFPNTSTVLAPGVYRITATARAAGQRSRQTITVRVLPGGGAIPLDN